MRKFFLGVTLLASLASSAQNDFTYKMTKLAEMPVSTLSNYKAEDCRSAMMVSLDADQLAAMLLDKSTASLRPIVIDPGVEAPESLPAAKTTAITMDIAGLNAMYGLTEFPGAFKTDGPQIMLLTDPEPESEEQIARIPIQVPADLANIGRCDYFGLASGDVSNEDGGTLVLQGSNSGDKLLVINIVNGQYASGHLATVTGATIAAGSSNVINAWLDDAGQVHYLYVNRSAAPIDMILDPETGNFTGTVINGLPNKGAANGAEAFSANGANYIVYPTLPNYQNGFAIARLDKDASGSYTPVTVATAPATLTANANTFQANWLHAEVEGTRVRIFQYVPGDAFRVYDLDIQTAGVNDNLANKVVSSVSYTNIQGITQSTPFSGVNFKVIEYSDGTRRIEKIVEK